jgi:lipoprotein-releasing system ATP-binding protein
VTKPDLLTATNISRQFETKQGILPVLKEVNLTLKEGDLATVTGASGVGKSTLLHILGGLDQPTTGDVTIESVSLTSQSESERARFRNSRVGFVFQHHYLMEDFSALENVMIPQLVAGIDQKRARAKGEQLLDRVGLRDRTTHRPAQLSGGEQQRVAVARALANDPQIVLADEPSGNLDINTGRSLHDLLLSVNKDQGVTFLIATHNPELAEVCPRCFSIEEGRLLEKKTGGEDR